MRILRIRETKDRGVKIILDDRNELKTNIEHRSLGYPSFVIHERTAKGNSLGGNEFLYFGGRSLRYARF